MVVRGIRSSIILRRTRSLARELLRFPGRRRDPRTSRIPFDRPAAVCDDSPVSANPHPPLPFPRPGNPSETVERKRRTVPIPSSCPEILLAPRVPALRGIAWWTESVSWLFRGIAGIGVWVGMLLILFGSLALLHLIPYLGFLVSHLLFFVFTGGLMVAADKTARGQTPTFSDLFAGFGPKGGALLGAALVLLVASIGATAVVALIGVGSYFDAMFHGAGHFAPDSLPDLSGAATGSTMMSLGWRTFGLVVLALVLYLPITMASWLAPALIMLRDAAPGEALRLSLRAGWRNGSALTMYGLFAIGLALLATLPVLVGWLFFGPLAYLSTYAASRDLFECEREDWDDEEGEVVAELLD